MLSILVVRGIVGNLLLQQKHKAHSILSSIHYMLVVKKPLTL